MQLIAMSATKSVPYNKPAEIQPIDYDMCVIIQTQDHNGFQKYFENYQDPCTRGHMMDNVFAHALERGMVDELVGILKNLEHFDVGLINVDQPGSPFLDRDKWQEDIIYQTRCCSILLALLDKTPLEYLVCSIMRHAILVDNMSLCKTITSRFPIEIWDRRKVFSHHHVMTTSIMLATDLKVFVWNAYSSQFNERDGMFSSPVNMDMVRHLLSFHRDWSPMHVYSWRAQMLEASTSMSTSMVKELMVVINQCKETCAFQTFAVGWLSKSEGVWGGMSEEMLKAVCSQL